MCGITGYIGKRQAVRLSVEQLQRLEYRGYDSAGVACCANGHVEVLKAQGKIAVLKQLLETGTPEATVAVAHTRWATHGRPSTPNAHPHTDCGGQIAVVHNGIIENYLELRERLMAAGHEFRSETDTEVLPHLIEAHYHGDMEQAIRDALTEVRGSYAIAVVSSYDKNTLYAARKDSPLVIGLGDGENFVASDIPAVLGQTRDVIVLEDGDFAVIRCEGVRVTSLNGAPLERSPMKVTWDAESAEWHPLPQMTAIDPLLPAMNEPISGGRARGGCYERVRLSNGRVRGRRAGDGGGRLLADAFRGVLAFLLPIARSRLPRSRLRNTWLDRRDGRRAPDRRFRPGAASPAG